MQQAIGNTDAWAWKTATDAECLAVGANDCRCVSKVKATGAKTSSQQGCADDLASCFNNAALKANFCAAVMNGTTNKPLYAWTAAADDTCAAMTAAQCRCTDKTAGTGTRSTTADTTSCASACPAASASTTAASTTSATTGSAAAGAGGEGEAAGEGEGAKAAATGGAAGESYAPLVAFFLAMLTLL